jgi:uncharacterized ParB-like nuclease family protein
MATETLLEICLFGGAADGATAAIENCKERVRIGTNQYSDSFFVDKDGRAIYYASKGPGRLTPGYIKKLFKED